jgi:FMN phosphatase YigB (HAD superfamily)
MNNIRDKVILTDVDGVLLDWEYHFYKWVKEKYNLSQLVTGTYSIADALAVDPHRSSMMVAEFNSSKEMKSISPLRDAVKYIRKFHEEHGFIFHVITSQTTDPIAQEWRKQNLIDTFGNVFDGFSILGCGDDKSDALAQWEGSECYWIEDKEENIVAGNHFGLDGLLMAHPHNFSAFSSFRVNNWKEIYQIITGET